MILFKNVFLIVLFTFVLWSAFPQSKIADSLGKRISNLEDYKANIEQLYNINSEKLTKHIDEKMAEKVKDIEEAKRLLNWILILGSLATIVGLPAVYFSAIKKTRKIILERIENIVEHKREDFIRLIETQEFDTKLKNTKKLLVLSANEETNNRIKETFTKLRFKEVNFRVVDKYIEYTNYDLIIFNDADGSFRQEIITEYVHNTPNEDISFVVYTIKNLNRHPRINFSNSAFTLYHSILSTLKYTEILKVV